MKFILFIFFIMAWIPCHSLSCIPIEMPCDPDTLCLSSSSGYFSFGLTSAFDETSSKEVVYKWMLKGYDKEWHVSNKRRRIYYAGLNPGHYLLTVRAFSRFYRKGLAQKELVIIVHPAAKANKGVLFLYLSLLFLCAVSVCIQAILLRKKVPESFVEEKINVPVKVVGYAVPDLIFLEKVKYIMEKHCCDPHFTLGKFYKEIGMSRSSFNSKWKALGMESPKLYLSHIRLEKAQRLLDSTSLSITIIAEYCGFCDAKYFREVFKSKFGMSPSEYRKSQINPSEKEVS